MSTEGSSSSSRASARISSAFSHTARAWTGRLALNSDGARRVLSSTSSLSEDHGELARAVEQARQALKTG